MKIQFKLLCGVAALMVAGSAAALTQYKWTTDSTTAKSTTGTQATVTVSGWADTGDGQKLQSQTLTKYDQGLGLTNSRAAYDPGESGSPEHAIDNSDFSEMLLLSFSTDVRLTKLDFSVWADSDITVLAYTGTKVANPEALKLSDRKYSDLTSNGWSLVSSIANFGASIRSIGNTSFYSSYFLVGAYNVLGGSSAATGFSLSDDAVKLQSVTACISGSADCIPTSNDNKVPEPGSIALLGLGLIGLVGARRRNRH